MISKNASSNLTIDAYLPLQQDQGTSSKKGNLFRKPRSAKVTAVEPGPSGGLDSLPVPDLLIRPLTASACSSSRTADVEKKSRVKSSLYKRRKWNRSARVKTVLSKTDQTQSIKIFGENNNHVNLNKIELQRCGLTSWPRTEDKSPSPKMMSLQHNRLSKIDPPNTLSNLVVLDLYRNQIGSLDGLKHAPNLRVLLLAKNRITSLSGVSSVPKIEVLDLHGNLLSSTQGLSSLKNLKHLNLANNLLRHVSKLSGLDSLVELNLRRNQIRTVSDLQNLSCLEKVYLNYNDIYRYEDILCLQQCIKLREIALDENPISKHPSYFYRVATTFRNISRLDDYEVSEESRSQSEEILRKLERGSITLEETTTEARSSSSAKATSHWNTLKANHKRFLKPHAGKSTEEKMKFNLRDFFGFPDDSRKDNQKNLLPNPNQLSPSEIKRNNTFPNLTALGTNKNNFEAAPKTTANQTPPKSKFQLSRSRSSFDIKLNNINERNGKVAQNRPKSSLNSNSNQSSNSQSNMTSRSQNSSSPYQRNLQEPMSNKTVMDKNNRKFNTPIRKMKRTCSESKLAVSQGNQATNKFNVFTKSNIIEKTEYHAVQYGSQKYGVNEESITISTKVLTIAFSKIQTNLQHLNKNFDPQYHFVCEEKQMESSEEESSSSSSEDEHIVHESSTPVKEQIIDSPNFGFCNKDGPKFFAKMDNNILRIYGNGTLAYPELLWEKCATTTANTVLFEHIEFDDILEIFPCLRIRFPNLENFKFVETNISKIGQLNALSEIHHMNSIVIKSNGNPITSNKDWPLFAIFRLFHWGVNVINDVRVSDLDRQRASFLYSTLSQMAFSSLPQQQLKSLISSTSQNSNNAEESELAEKNSILNNSKFISPKPNLKFSQFYLQELIGKESLQYKPKFKLSNNEKAAIREAEIGIFRLHDWAFECVLRLRQLEKVWPAVLHDLARDAITDLRKPNYGKLCLDLLKEEMMWIKESNT